MVTAPMAAGSNRSAWSGVPALTVPVTLFRNQKDGTYKEKPFVLKVFILRPRSSLKRGIACRTFDAAAHSPSPPATGARRWGQAPAARHHVAPQRRGVRAS